MLSFLPDPFWGGIGERRRWWKKKIVEGMLPQLIAHCSLASLIGEGQNWWVRKPTRVILSRQVEFSSRYAACQTIPEIWFVALTQNLRLQSQNLLLLDRWSSHQIIECRGHCWLSLCHSARACKRSSSCRAQLSLRIRTTFHAMATLGAPAGKVEVIKWQGLLAYFLCWPAILNRRAIQNVDILHADVMI